MIIGVDPGETTGILFYYHPQRVVHLEQKPRDASLTLLNEISMRMEHDELDAVVCERYDITQETLRNKRVRDPYHMEGFVKLVCLMYGASFVQYGRSEAKHFATDRKLDVLGWRILGMNHANDAARQVLTHIGDQTAIALELAKGLRGDS